MITIEKSKETDIKQLISKVETLISEALKTDFFPAHQAANDVYYLLNQKFAKYLE